MFGYRVRVGIVGRMSSELDLCGGNNLEMIDLLYNGCRVILEGQLKANKGKGGASWVSFGEFPEQKIKPFYKDLDFLGKFCDLVMKYSEDEVTPEEMKITREKLNLARMGQMEGLINRG